MVRPAGFTSKALALLCCLVALAGQSALVLFVIVLGLDALPESVSLPFLFEPSTGVWPWVIDIGWLLAFALQHSGMARDRWKNNDHLVPVSLERSFYAALSGLLLLGLCLTWQPLPGASLWRSPLWVSAVGILGALANTACALAFDSLGLFGIRQVWEQGRPARPDSLTIVGPYRYLRHPLMASLLVFLWGQPVMPPTLALLGGGLTVYILIGIRLEERDLIRRFGTDYERYRRQVPMLIPWRRPLKPQGESSSLGDLATPNKIPSC